MCSLYRDVHSSHGWPSDRPCTKELVRIMRKWHVLDGILYCPQCWGLYLARLRDTEPARRDSRDGNLPWARQNPICEMCGKDARDIK